MSTSSTTTATTTTTITDGKNECFSCKKLSRTFECDGCKKNYCFDCLPKHLENLKKDFKLIENEYEKFHSKLNVYKNHLSKDDLIEQIDQWEFEAITKIKQMAQKSRQKISNYKYKFLLNIENRFDFLSKQIKQLNQSNQFDLNQLEELKLKLELLKNDLDQPLNIRIQQQSSSFINRIFVIIPLDKDIKWCEDGITVAGGNGQGNQLNQLNYPRGISIDENETIYIADSENDRVIQWKSNSNEGQIIQGGNGKGKNLNQLNLPTDVIQDKLNNCLFISDELNKRILKSSITDYTNRQIFLDNMYCSRLTIDKLGNIYVSDWKNNEVRQWNIQDKQGKIVAGGNGKGSNLNQLNSPSYIFIDEDFSLYISDTDNHRIVKWIKDANEGYIVAGGNGKGNDLSQLFEPRGIAVYQSNQIFVADWGNHRIMLWIEGNKQGTIIIGLYGQGPNLNQLNSPIGLAIDHLRNIYVSDCLNHRILKFSIQYTK